MVYTSTTSTIGSLHPRKCNADDSTPLIGFRSRSPYARTKQQAEQILLASDKGPECIILNPAEVVGAYDHSLQWGRIILALARRQLPFLPPGSCTFSPAFDVAKAHVTALTQGRPGHRYILGGEHLLIARFTQISAKLLAVPVEPHDQRPYFIQRWHAAAQEFLQPVLKAAPVVDAYRMRIFGGHHLFDDSAARRELNYQPQLVERAIQECIDWYSENGFFVPNPSVKAQSK